MRNILQFPFSIINKLIPKVNLNLAASRKTYFVKNVFKASHQKRALVSYLAHPFLKGVDNKHTNHLECFFAAKTLDKLGYLVDVVDYDHMGIVDFRGYAVIYGFGDQFEASFKSDTFLGKRILYSPGCNTTYSNKVSAARLLAFQKNGGRLDTNLIRTTNSAWPLQKYLSDAIICLGNNFVLNSYKNDFNQTNYYQINCFPLERSMDIPIVNKNFSEAKHSLLWFGSQGSVHKGLDIALNLIDKRSELKLYVRGLNLRKESAVLEPYQHLIRQGRVDVKQYVDIRSNEFKTLMMDCGAAIFPSASEGGAAALLAVMTYGGLIPIVTKSCGLDIAHMGFVAEETSTESVELALDNYLKIDVEELKVKSLSVQQEISTVYNQQNYLTRLEQILHEILA